ncbi:hypothetical protein F8388_019521 [Cannabis sativa]|uniref:Ripening-related protein 1 n=1 Tax=Cannabis sativa TaxID=3483 RepID=A0A7J6DSR2_CANSA|nr:hypothetical protein F8388_019521 [Cannabis sativa]KAF4394894.1 hypothetical protein G4B88_002771 [Cannabis sativa]
MKSYSSSSILCFLLILITPNLLSINEAKSCNPSGKIRGKKPPPGQCNPENQSECCKRGKFFGKGGDGGGPSECDKKFHSDETPVVALSTGWFNNRQRCLQNITIHGNGRSVTAMVVDECDSRRGCDAAPCPNNIVDASKAVWKASVPNALGISF